jgi:hypothetical protein
MSTPTPKSDYLMLFRGTEWYQGLSPEEIQRIVGQVLGWLDGLTKAGVVKAARPLGEQGRTLSGPRGRTVADGPFAESKEAIAGYVLFQAASLEDAVAIAQDHPGLTHGFAVEIRPVLQECAIAKGACGQATLTHF